MQKNIRVLIPVLLILAGLALLMIYLYQPVTIIVNSERNTVRTPALTVADILRAAGYPLYVGDQVTPADSAWLLGSRPIHLKNSSSVILWLEGERIPLTTTERFPANVLQEYGIYIFPGDTLMVDGKSSIADVPFSAARVHTLQFNKPVLNQTISTPSTIGATLARQGRPLMGLDRSIPAEGTLYTGGDIQIQRVTDSIVLESSILPFEYQSIQNPEVELDQQVITQAGEYGLAINLTRLRIVDGVEESRQSVNSTTIREPVDQILSYGTKAVVKQATVDGISLEYWRAVPMYATTYAPGESGGGGFTASGKPVVQGVAAVIRSWYAYMQGQQVYVPGYGYATIEDIGGGIPGKPWIDLGYDDAHYQSWSGWVTVYFLTPVPPNIMYILN